jgi:hypothetical protein
VSDTNIDDIDAVTAQEFRDLWMVWAWIKSFGGVLNEGRVCFNLRLSRKTTVFGYLSHGPDWFHQAAEWVREQYKNGRNGTK